MFKIIYWIARIVLFPFYRYRFEGLENVPAGPCLICPNHTAIIDSVLVVLAVGADGNYAAMGKAEIFKNPLFTAAMRLVKVFPVKRGGNDVGAVKTALKALKDGKRLIIFPQGTRVKAGDADVVKSGAGMLAIRGKVPVVPVYVPEGKKAGRRNVIRFGAPMEPPAPEGRRADAEDYADFSRQIMDRIYALAPGQLKRGEESA